MDLTDSQKIVALVAGILGLPFAIFKIYSAIRNTWGARIRIHRIVSPADDAFPEVCELHKKEFSTNAHVADDPADLQRWLEESIADRARGGGSNLDELLLAATANRKVVGYMFAQYYFDSRMLFISYLGIDKDSEPKIKRESRGATMLLLHAVKYLDRMKYNWRGIVTEVEEFEMQKDGKLKPHAKEMMALFQRYLKYACEEYKGINTDLYRIGIEYKQPILRPEEVSTHTVDDTFRQWLLYAPRNREALLDSSGKIYLDRSTIVEILRLIFLETYADAFRDDDGYKQYLQDEFEKSVAALPEKILLSKNWRDAQKVLAAAGKRFDRPCLAT